jgi:hypothetical protein
MLKICNRHAAANLPSADRPEQMAMTETYSIHVQTPAPSCIHSADVSVRCGSPTAAEARLGDDCSINEKPPDFQGFEAFSARLRLPAGSTGDGTRTHDLRIMRPPHARRNCLIATRVKCINGLCGSEIGST